MPSNVPARNDDRKQVARQSIVEELRARILDGTYGAGARVRQEDVAEEFNLSRLPVREALRELESEGLLIIEPHRGARVAAVDRTELEQIYTLRAAVEPLAIQRSVPNLEPTDFEDLERLATRMEQSHDIEEFLSADREFHLASYRGVQFPLIVQLVERFWNTTQHYRRSFAEVRTPDQFQLAHSDHRMLIQAARDKNSDVAAAIVKRHIERTRDDLMALLQAVDNAVDNAADQTEARDEIRERN